jgi:hypothetical protein
MLQQRQAAKASSQHTTLHCPPKVGFQQDPRSWALMSWPAACERDEKESEERGVSGLAAWQMPVMRRKGRRGGGNLFLLFRVLDRLPGTSRARQHTCPAPETHSRQGQSAASCHGGCTCERL